MQISKGMLIGTAVIGAAYFVIGEIFYRVFKDVLPMPVLIGLYFLGLALFVAMGCAVIVSFMYHSTQGYRDIVLRCIILIFAVFAAGVIFEFLYELQINGKQKEPESYIFLMDNSGSMEESDPQRKRYDAIEQILEVREESFPFAVYIFANGSKLVRDMAPVSEGIDFLADEPFGGTAIKGVLDTLYDDIESGKIGQWENGRVLLLSDGYATDMGLFGGWSLGKTLKNFSKKGISISTVGLGNPDDALMSRIAGKTGGVYISVDDAALLNQAMQEAITQKSSRNILDYRNDVKFDFIYMVLRFAAVLAIGLLMAGLKTYISESVLDTQPVLVSSVAGSLLAAFFVEFGMNKLGLYPWLMRLFMCVFLAAATLYESRRSRIDYNNQYENV